MRLLNGVKQIVFDGGMYLKKSTISLDVEIENGNEDSFIKVHIAFWGNDPNKPDSYNKIIQGSDYIIHKNPNCEFLSNIVCEGDRYITIEADFSEKDLVVNTTIKVSNCCLNNEKTLPLNKD